MPVETRKIRACHFGDAEALGAVETSRGTLAAFAPWVSHEALAGAEHLRFSGRAPVAIFAGEGEAPETHLFQGRNVVLAIRNGERAEAAVDWMSFLAAEFGAEAALILDRDPPESQTFSRDLTGLAPALPVVVVTADRPLGATNGPDLRDPALAPAAPKRGEGRSAPWHSPLAATSILEILRHRFLAEARAVALLGIADIPVPVKGRGSAFDLAAAHPGGVVPLRGIETYPWRLRKGAPAPHRDHIAHRRAERRRVLSWCVSPGGMPEDAVWTTGRMTGLPLAEAEALPFARAMGVVYPGVPVKTLVQKAELRESADLLALMSRAFEGDPLRLPAPPAIPPRPSNGKVTVVTAMKNEGPFILDWIAHNRAIGVERHLVYTNDCGDGTDRLLDLLSEAGVSRRENPYRSTDNVPQHAALRAAENESAVTGADWLVTLDVDEYVDIHVGEGRIPDLLDAVPDAHVISMPWRLFGNADRHAFEDRPVTELFPLAAPEYAPRPLQAWAFKSLYRNAGLFRRMGVHRPKGLATTLQDGLRWVDGSGRPLPSAVWRGAWRMSKAHWGYDLVTLNHYAVRSAESFLVKRERGRVNHTDRAQGRAYWFRMNHNAEEASSIRRHDPRVAQEKAALLALPGVAAAHEAAVAWHRARIAALRQDREYAALFQAITSDKYERLSRIATNFGMAAQLAGPEAIPDEVAFRDPAAKFFWTLPGG